MILYGSTMSPFVRVVRVVAREIGALGRIEEVTADPWGSEAFRRVNPLGKIPALVTDEGDVFYDSGVICEYLDTLHGGPRLFLPEGRARWRMLTMRACAHGLMNAAYLRRNEAIRPDCAMISNEFVDRQDAAIRAALDVLETGIESIVSLRTIAALAAGTALGYLDFRFAECGWRDRCPALAMWWAELSSRHSFADTEHADPPGVTAPAMALTLRLD
jgi:glutathione S-transferase